jgi:hypothetical protein
MFIQAVISFWYSELLIIPKDPFRFATIHMDRQILATFGVQSSLDAPICSIMCKKRLR